jgi:molybdopterin-guanine dinucleotide biosynthesis protein A
MRQNLRCYHFCMIRAGFVLAGGRSSRMGRDKALLPFKGRTLLECVALEVHAVTGDVTLVGDINRHSYLSYPVIEDIFPGRGPLAGIHAALTVSRAEWNLIVACDMPDLTSDFLRKVMERAESGSADAVLPAGPSGLPEPLCAAYRRRSLTSIADALERGIRKVTDGLAGLEVDIWRVPEARYFHNFNTPDDLSSYANG